MNTISSSLQVPKWCKLKYLQKIALINSVRFIGIAFAVTNNESANHTKTVFDRFSTIPLWKICRNICEILHTVYIEVYQRVSLNLVDKND
jgi:hypothetical protein